MDFGGLPENVGDTAFDQQVTTIVLAQNIQEILLGFPIAEETVQVTGAYGFIRLIKGLIHDDVIYQC